MKKYLLALLALTSIAYVVHTRTMTEAEEQPFLDEEKFANAEQPEPSLFIEKIKQFFTASENDESKIEPAASAETVLEGSRPAFAARQSATRAVVPRMEDTESSDGVMPEDSETAPLLAEDLLITGSAALPESDEAFSLVDDTQVPENPIVIEEFDTTSPEELLNLSDETEWEEINAPAIPEPEIQSSEELSTQIPKSAVQKEMSQLKKEAIQGIE